jgi:hypothetical protein
MKELNVEEQQMVYGGVNVPSVIWHPAPPPLTCPVVPPPCYL